MEKKELTLEEYRALMQAKLEPKYPETSLAGWWERQDDKHKARGKLLAHLQGKF